MSRQTNAIAVTTIGIDTGKNTLHLIGLDEHGTIVLRGKLARGRIRTGLANVPPCLIGIEAGMATHYVTRELLALGHDVRQVPPAYAKPFRQCHKNDFRDAHAIAEAVQRPSNTLRFGEDRGSVGPASAAPGAISPGRSADSCYQSDPKLSFGARHCSAPGAALPAHRIADHPCPAA